MSVRMVELNCPGCGARVAIDQKTCDWCHKPLIISTFQSVYDMPMKEVNSYKNFYQQALAEEPKDKTFNKSVAMCYLKLGLYKEGQRSFEKAIEDNFDDADIYLYAAVCLLEGKRPYMVARQIVDKAIRYLDAALMIEPKGIFYHFRAYLKYDYYEMKRLRITPGFMDDWKQAGMMGVSEADKHQLFEILKVQRPQGF